MKEQTDILNEVASENREIPNAVETKRIEEIQKKAQKYENRITELVTIH